MTEALLRWWRGLRLDTSHQTDETLAAQVHCLMCIICMPDMYSVHNVWCLYNRSTDSLTSLRVVACAYALTGKKSRSCQSANVVDGRPERISDHAGGLRSRPPRVTSRPLRSLVVRAGGLDVCPVCMLPWDKRPMYSNKRDMRLPYTS